MREKIQELIEEVRNLHGYIFDWESDSGLINEAVYREDVIDLLKDFAEELE